MGNFFQKFWWLLLIIILILLLTIAWLLFFKDKKADKSIPTATISATPEATTSATPSSQTKTESDAELLKKAVSEKTGIALDIIIVDVSENTGKHAKGTVTAEGETVGGGYWLAVKEGGKWTIVYDGQSTPECSQVDPPGFPASMVPECFDADGNIVTRS